MSRSRRSKQKLSVTITSLKQNLLSRGFWKRNLPQIVELLYGLVALSIIMRGLTGGGFQITLLMWVGIAWLNYKSYMAANQRSQTILSAYEQLGQYTQAQEQFAKKLIDLLQKLDKKILRKHGVKIDVTKQEPIREPN